MGSKEKDSFWKFECMATEIEEVTDMLWYIYEDYYSYTNNDLYTKANYYDRLGTLLINIHSLLLSKQNEMKQFIEDVCKEKCKEENQ